MKKNMIHQGILFVIQLAVYHAAVFLIPFSRNVIFWCCYGFSLFAQFVAAGAYYIAYLKKTDARTVFYSFPIYRIGLIYQILQIVLSFVFMAMANELAVWLVLLVQIAMLAVALSLLLYGKKTRDVIVNLDQSLEKKTSQIRNMQSQMRKIESLCEDETMRKAVSDFSQELSYSDPVSSEALMEMEIRLQELIEELELAVRKKEINYVRSLCESAKCMLEKRNIQCKLNKKRFGS